MWGLLYNERWELASTWMLDAGRGFLGYNGIEGEEGRGKREEGRGKGEGGGVR